MTGDENQLGPQFRALRTARGLSLIEVAEATYISSSFLSLFETGKSDITFGRLARLVEFFGVSITDLIPDPEPEQTVVVRRNARRRVKSPTEHAAIELLAHHTKHKMLPLLVVFEPGGESSETIDPTGGELFLMMLQGEVEIDDGVSDPIRLRKGDAAYFLTDRKRTYRTVGSKRAEWIAVQTPTAF